MDDPKLQAKLKQLEAELNSSAPSAAHPAAQAKPAPPAQSWSSSLKSNVMLPLYLVAIPWTQEIIDQVVFGGRWNMPLHPRSIEGIPGIFLSAFSHANFAHLIGNTIGFLIFSWLILAKSRRDYWVTLLVGWLGGGVAAWLLGPSSVHGLSGVVYTLFGYLLCIGWLERRIVPLLISVFVLINYSTFIFGIFPTQPMVAWWGHLFGLVLGIVAAYGVYQEPVRRR
ncbi:rhomboid family intramembrane serine protease [Nodosilinea sp. LEGE 07088]|uniref:rhomboid family intramembrane serine protease n=1 Tax=Nodosilinea sp. LEGE 07088 TaxID=2777968 RepID=UPI001881C60E|nr:rhomboid family intramembrane serine protease [Nodosilinea sp. LEGE 07088]MBE9139316.1 rhomboid family intramembrane serine protease [Nodosilinea sp. LEGE 07088]